MNPIVDKGAIMWLDVNGQFHRLDGPAVIHENGTKHWFRHGVYHRLDGPSTEWNCGTIETEYWWLGKCYTEQHHTLISNRKFFTRKVKI